MEKHSQEVRLTDPEKKISFCNKIIFAKPDSFARNCAVTQRLSLKPCIIELII